MWYKYYQIIFKEKPKIAVLGLNPHNSELSKNSEEIKKIIPAILYLKKKVNIDGPFVSDSFFINDYKKYNPFKVKRSAGVGVRIFLPMFGLLGLDYGFGFDPLDPGAQGEVNHNAQIKSNGYRGQFHFTIGMNIGEL